MNLLNAIESSGPSSIDTFVEPGYSMNATSRTLVFVGVAAVAAVAAMGVRYANQPASIEGFSDVGQEFFTDFKDPLKALELSVVKYDAESKEPISFSVRQNEKGLWVIPSHHDYPAEAAERLAKTAASLIGIRKTAVQSRSKDDWARYGVEDPSAEATAVADGEKDEARGTRITLRDTSSNALVDLIVGKAVEGRSKHFYVRQPEKNPVFIAQLDSDLSAKFSDWIEPDLLKLNQNDIVKVVVDQYSVDEEQGAIVKGDIFEFAKDAAANKWAMAGLDLNVESLKEAAVTDITRNLDQLKIVGVRPKPAGLNADLTVTREVAGNPLLQKVLQTDMQRQGFYIARDASEEVKLVSNEGELVAGTNNGVKYTLYFGEIARGTAKDIETGLNETATADGEKPADEAKKTEGEEKLDDKPADPEAGPRRYLLVKVEFDESLLGEKPSEPVAPEKPAILNDGGTPATPEEKPADAPKADAAPEAAPKDPPPAEEKPAEDKPPEEKAAEPAKEEPTPEAAAEPASEKPAEPGSCDEPPAAAEPAVADPPVVADPPTDAKPAADAVPQETPATPEPAAPAKEGEPGAETATPAEPPAADAAKPTEPTEPTEPPADPKAEAQKQYDQALGEYEAAKAGFEGAVKSWEGRAKAGQKTAQELSDRFSTWYYVISADSFEKFKLSREAVVGPKEEAKPADGPTIPGGGSIPNFDLPGLGN